MNNDWIELRLEILKYFKEKWPNFKEAETIWGEGVDWFKCGFKINGVSFPGQEGSYFRKDPFQMMRIPGDFIDTDSDVQKFCVVTKIKDKDLGAMMYWLMVKEYTEFFHPWIYNYRSFYIKDPILNSKMEQFYKTSKLK